MNYMCIKGNAEMINKNYEIKLKYCKPRPAAELEIVAPKAKTTKERIPWRFEISLFKDYKIDNMVKQPKLF